MTSRLVPLRVLRSIFCLKQRERKAIAEMEKESQWLGAWQLLMLLPMTVQMGQTYMVPDLCFFLGDKKSCLLITPRRSYIV